MYIICPYISPTTSVLESFKVEFFETHPFRGIYIYNLYNGTLPMPPSGDEAVWVYAKVGMIPISLLLGILQGSLYYQPKQCTINGTSMEIPQIYHRFALFDAPPNR